MKHCRLLHHVCRATTLPELLVVIIISGILFLSLFEGMNMLTRYSRMIRERLTDKGELLYSHSTLEQLLEDTDSICRNRTDERTLQVYRNGETKCTLSFDSIGCVVVFGNLHDTLFTRKARFELFPPREKSYPSEEIEIHRIDSIVVSVPMDTDTLTLTYAAI